MQSQIKQASQTSQKEQKVEKDISAEKLENAEIKIAQYEKMLPMLQEQN